MENNDNHLWKATLLKNRFGTFPDIVHELPDRTSQLNSFPRALRNPGCNRNFARMPEGSDGRTARNACCNSSTCFSREKAKGTLVLTESFAELSLTTLIAQHGHVDQLRRVTLGLVALGTRCVHALTRRVLHKLKDAQQTHSWSTTFLARSTWCLRVYVMATASCHFVRETGVVNAMFRAMARRPCSTGGKKRWKTQPACTLPGCA